MSADPSHQTRIQADKAFGDVFAQEFEHIRAIANGFMKGESRQVTMQGTALAHEAYLRLVADPDRHKGGTNLIPSVARAMRQILVEAARMRKALKRTGGRVRVTLADDLATTAPTDDSLLELDETLSRLQKIDPKLGRLVELKFFCGLSIDQLAIALDSSPATVKREWKVARAWLAGQLDDGECM